MNPHRLPVLLSALAALCVASPRLLAQGALVPSAAPGPIMKTLDQVEARTALVAGSPGVTVAANGGITISASGSYYLTKNIIVQPGGTGNGINITSSGVTVDLNGFTISSVVSPAAGSGIYLQSSAAPVSQITITNGHIRSGSTVVHNTTAHVFTLTPGNGFINGIFSPASSFKNISIAKVSVSGVTNMGISLERENITEMVPTGQPTHISDCTISDCGIHGIIGDFINKCSVLNIGNNGIIGQRVIQCTSVAGFIGIKATHVESSSGTAIVNATGSFQTWGINAGRAANSTGWAMGANSTGLSASVATNCGGTSDRVSAADSSGVGLTATLANGCTAQSVSGVQMNAGSAIGCYIYVFGPTDNDRSIITRRYNMP